MVPVSCPPCPGSITIFAIFRPNTRTRERSDDVPGFGGTTTPSYFAEGDAGLAPFIGAEFALAPFIGAEVEADPCAVAVEGGVLMSSGCALAVTLAGFGDACCGAVNVP